MQLLLYFLFTIASGTTDGGLGREIVEKTVHSLTDPKRFIQNVESISKSASVPSSLLGPQSSAGSQAARKRTSMELEKAAKVAKLEKNAIEVLGGKFNTKPAASRNTANVPIPARVANGPALEFKTNAQSLLANDGNAGAKAIISNRIRFLGHPVQGTRHHQNPLPQPPMEISKRLFGYMKKVDGDKILEPIGLKIIRKVKEISFQLNKNTVKRSEINMVLNALEATTRVHEQVQMNIFGRRLSQIEYAELKNLVLEEVVDGNELKRTAARIKWSAVSEKIANRPLTDLQNFALVFAASLEMVAKEKLKKGISLNV
jgi:hypothetical protein